MIWNFIKIYSYDLNNKKENTFCLPYLERLLKVTEEHFVYYKENAEV